MAGIDLIVGLGNPEARYEQTRHNVGFWFVDALAQRQGVSFRHEGKFFGEACRITLHGRDCWLLKPLTYMNRSGQAVAALAQFYKIDPAGILVVHDDLDLPPGTVRLKQGGGHGGHNGLRDIIAALGNNGFARLRLGIGHPGTSGDVTPHVLGKPPQSERALVEQAMDAVFAELPRILGGEIDKAMNHLHSRKAT